MVRYDFEKEKKKLYKKNLAETKKATNTKWLKEKVHNFSDNFDFKEEKVIEEIKNNDIVAANFIKDPGRQNFYENKAIEFLQNIKIVKKIEKLKPGGRNALYVINGEIKNKRPNKTHKSIDFKITLKNNKTLFVSHKYTKDNGGAQDNQKNDLLHFIENAKKYTGNDYMFMVLADGNYYLQTNIRKEFEKAVKNSKVLFCNIENFEDIISKIK